MFIWQQYQAQAVAELLSDSSFIWNVPLTSHSSHLLISLLLSIGVRVIGYFTHVRVELAEGKGQATRLSVSCTTVIHQLLSGTSKATVALSRHFVKPHLGHPVNPLTRGRVSRAEKSCFTVCSVSEHVNKNYKIIMSAGDLHPYRTVELYIIICQSQVNVVILSSTKSS